MVELPGERDLSDPGLYHRGPDHAPDPFITPGSDRKQRVIVLEQ